MTGVQTGAGEKSKQGPQLMQVLQSFKSLPEFILGQEGLRLIDNTQKDDFYEVVCWG